MKIIFRIFLVLILLAVGAGGFFIYKHTDGCNSGFKTFYVEYEGHHLDLENEHKYNVGTTHRFNIVYPLDVISKEQKGYSVCIVPNVNVDSVEYKVDGRWNILSGVSDITAAFDLTCEEDSFTLTIPKDFNVKTVLDKTYPDKTVEVDDKYIDSDEPFYMIVITSYDNSTQYIVNFGVVQIYVKDVDLNITRIVL